VIGEQPHDRATRAHHTPRDRSFNAQPTEGTRGACSRGPHHHRTRLALHVRAAEPGH
jgi:hypothetical protein